MRGKRATKFNLIPFSILLSLVLLLNAPPTLLALNTITRVNTWGGAANDIASGVTTDSLGHIYITGSTGSFGAGGFDVFLLKYDYTGNLLWQRTWGGSKDDYAAGGGGISLGAGRGVATDSAGNAYVAGSTLSYGYNNNFTNAFLLKFDPQGNLLWQRTWGGTSYERTQALALDAFGSIYLTGYTNSSGAGGGDIFLIKVNSTGNLQWQRTWGGSDLDEGFGLTIDSSGYAYVAGYTQSFGIKHAVLLKFNSTGSLQWQRNWGGSSADLGSSVAADVSGDIYMAGSTGSFATPTNDSASHWDVFLLKFDATGNLLLQETWGGTGFDHGNDATVDANGTIYVSGVTASTQGGVFLLHLNPDGTILQQVAWGPDANDGEDRGITVDSVGRVFVTGIVSSPPPYLLVSTGFTLQTPVGTVGVTRNSTTGTSPFHEDSPSGIVMTPAGNQTYAGLKDAFLFEYGQSLASSAVTPLDLTLITSLLVISLLLIGRRSTKGPRETIRKKSWSAS